MLKAQTDDLMIVEYMDSDDGDGLGLKIYNPTSQTINLDNYTIATYHNGNTTSASSDDLYGTLNTGESIIFGNNKYCGGVCSSGCNSISINGSNGNDAIVLQKGISIIDMIGPLGADTDIKIDGQNNGLFEDRILRNSDNCIRYFAEAGTSIHSWPDNDDDNVDSWSVMGLSCISQAPFSFQLPDFELNIDTTLCDTQELNLDYTDLNFQSYQWVDQNNNTPIINISDSGIYTLRVQNENFCSAEDDIIVNFESCDSIIPEDSIIPTIPADSFFIPNIITPNGDLINDQFVISGVDTNLVVLDIYNRWGKNVYSRIDYQNDWKAEGLNDGTYFYKVIIDNTTEYKGHLEVKR